MRKFWLAALAGAMVFAGACTDPGVTGLNQTDPAAYETELPQSTVETTEELDMTTPLPESEVSAFADIDVPTPVPVFTATPGPSMSFNYEFSDRINVHYYDWENDRPATTPYPVTDKSDPQAVLEGVNAAYADILKDQNIQINDVRYSGGNLFVDFAPSIYNLNIGSEGERQVLESIADTYLTNVQGIEAVYYTVDGQPYNSDNISLAENESYKTLLG